VVGFTLRQLQYFVATCEAQSIAAAAEREYISASAISAAIAHLEEALGVQLFVRQHAQGVAPTTQGRALLAEARALLKQADDLERLGTELSGELAGPLRVGCLVTLAATVVPRMLRAFSDANPNVAVELVDAGQNELLDGLRSGRLDLAVTYDLEVGQEFHFERICDLPPVAILPAGHPLAASGSVSLRRLAREPLVLLDLPLSREYFLGLFAARRLEPHIGGRSAHLDVVCSLVGNGHGYSLVNVPPASLRAPDGSPLAAATVAGAHRRLRMGLIRVAGQRETRAGAAFADHCRRSLPATVRPGSGGQAPLEHPPADVAGDHEDD
jgi:DNA-binding transcriptional LysR family regulator